MNTRIKILIVSIIITIATIIFCFSVLSTPAPTPSSSSYTDSEKKYVLKDFNGMLAIYENGKASPTEVLDVELSSLPERDIERIKKGIFADSLSEIYSIAEDYE